MENKEIQQMAEFEENYWWFKGRKKIIETILENQIKNESNLKILDIGCGTGATTLVLTKFGTVFGTDYSMSALKYSNHRGLDVLRSSVYELPFSSESFNVITIFDVLEHLENDQKVLKELKRILKKNGVIFITVPAYQTLWSDHDVALSHYRRYNSKSLSRVLSQAGLESIRMSYFISILFPLLAFLRIVSKLKKRKQNPKTNLFPIPSSINNLLQNVLSLENRIIQKTDLPFGLSLLCIGKKSGHYQQNPNQN